MNFESIPLDELLVDTENPRLADTMSDERAAILGILHDQGVKLVSLAEHVAEHGFSPIDLPLVYPGDSGRYIVAEGNRRIAALKILRNPFIIHGADPKLLKKFAAIAAARPNLPDSLTCVVLLSEAERNLWVKLRHGGEDGGVGLSEWKAKEKARFAARHTPDKTNRMEFSLQIVDLVRSRCTPGEIELLNAIPITTLERMVGDPAVRKALGIDRNAGGVLITIDDEESVLHALKLLVLEIARKDVKVGDVMSKPERQEKIDGWPEERKPGLRGEPTPPKPIHPSTPYAPANPTTAGAPSTSPATSGASVSPAPSASAATHQNPSLPTSQSGNGNTRIHSPDNRKKLVPQSFSVKIDDLKVKRIFIELKKLDIEEFENAAAVLLRVFLELSCEVFLTNNSVQFDDKEKLRKKMEKVADYWEQNSILKKTEITAWRNAVCSNDLFSLNVLHAHVHSLQSIPKKRDLIRTWDEISFYVEKLWRQ